MPRTDRRRASSALPVVLLLVALVILAGPLAGCGDAPGSGGYVSASGKPVTKQFDLSGFSAVRLDHFLQAAIVRDDGYQVAVTLDDNLIEHLICEVDGDTLTIGLDPKYIYSGQTFRVTVAMPELTALEVTGRARGRLLGFSSSKPLALKLSGGSIATLTTVRAGDVTVDSSGSSNVAGDLTAASMTASISGASRVGLEGSASSARLDGSGGSSFELPAFALETAAVKLSGGSRATVKVSGTLDADVSGGSQLGYVGSPQLGDVQTSGGGQVTQAAR